MTWYRNIFVDTLSSNDGALLVEDLGLTNSITFREVPNAILYTLYGRRAGSEEWIVIESIDARLNPGGFIDAFNWISSPTPVVVEYKVEVTKTSPVVADRYYTTGGGRSNDDPDLDPADRIPGVYEKVLYFSANTDVNEELSSRSDWSIESGDGKYEIAFSTFFSSTTTVNNITIDWKGDSLSSIKSLRDSDFTQHLIQLRDNWIAYIASDLRAKRDKGELNLSDLTVYCSDPEIKNADVLKTDLQMLPFTSTVRPRGIFHKTTN